MKIRELVGPIENPTSEDSVDPEEPVDTIVDQIAQPNPRSAKNHLVRLSKSVYDEIDEEMMALAEGVGTGLTGLNRRIQEEKEAKAALAIYNCNSGRICSPGWQKNGGEATEIWPAVPLNPGGRRPKQEEDSPQPGIKASSPTDRHPYGTPATERKKEEQGLFHRESIRGSTPAFAPAIGTIRRLKGISDKTRIMVERISRDGIGTSAFLEQIAQALANEVRCGIQSRLRDSKELQTAIIDSIGTDGRSVVYDEITIHWTLNTQLPSSKRLAYIPMHGYGDQFCVITERQFAQAILRTGTGSHLRKKLKHKLRQKACVVYPDGQGPRRVIDIKEPDSHTELESLSTLEASSEEYKSAKTTVKASIKAKIIEVTQDLQSRPGKYALTGTLTTDRVYLKLLAHNIAIPGPAAFEKEFGSQTDHVVLGLDPGIRRTVTGVVLDSTDAGKAWNVSLPKGTHGSNANHIEWTIQPVSTDLVEAELAGRFRELREQFETHIKSVAEVEEHPRGFYASHGLKVAKSRIQRGSRKKILADKALKRRKFFESRKRSKAPQWVKDDDLPSYEGRILKCYRKTGIVSISVHREFILRVAIPNVPLTIELAVQRSKYMTRVANEGMDSEIDEDIDFDADTSDGGDYSNDEHESDNKSSAYRLRASHEAP
ncbi:MAG: hypothetical protein J3Q66DRAFT_403022 [Benniella sp.]|nr:MAG: hypothetical protein J3Q66DRAFT_403022 [Benniella sp.]